MSDDIRFFVCFNQDSFKSVPQAEEIELIEKVLTELVLLARTLDESAED